MLQIESVNACCSLLAEYDVHLNRLLVDWASLRGQRGVEKGR